MLYRDNIYGITTPAIRRLSVEAGVKSITELAIQNTRDIMQKFIRELLKEKLELAKQNDRNYLIIHDFILPSNGNYNRTIFPKLSFKRVVWEFSQNMGLNEKNDINIVHKFTKDVTAHIQYFTEKYLKNLFELANKITLNSKRIRVNHEDLQLAYSACKA